MAKQSSENEFFARKILDKSLAPEHVTCLAVIENENIIRVACSLTLCPTVHQLGTDQIAIVFFEKRQAEVPVTFYLKMDNTVDSLLCRILSYKTM